MQCYSLFGAVHTNPFIVLLFCVETSYQKLHYFPCRRFHNNCKQSVVLIRQITSFKLWILMNFSLIKYRSILSL